MRDGVLWEPGGMHPEKKLLLLRLLLVAFQMPISFDAGNAS